MSELDGIKQGVEQVRGEVAQAKMVGEQALSVASDKVTELAMLGLEGVAQVLQTVADALDTAVAQLGTGFTFTDECVTGLSGVTDKTKMSDTAAALDVASEKLTAVASEVDGAGAQAADALTYAQESEVEPVMNAVAAAIGAIDQAKSVIETTKVKTKEYRAKIDAAGRGLLAASSGASTSPSGGRDLIATVGTSLQPPQGGPDDTSHHRAELKSADDDDKSLNRFRRNARAAVRNAGALHKQSKETTQTFVIKDREFFDPPVEQTQASVGVAVPPPKIVPAIKESGMIDGISNGIVMTVFAVEAFSRRFRR